MNSLARYIRIVEVRGSNPLSSTTHPRRLKSFRGFFVRKMIFGKYDIISSSSVYMDVGGERHVSNVKGPDSAPHRDQEFERLVEQYQTAVLRMHHRKPLSRYIGLWIPSKAKAVKRHGS